MKPKLRCQSCAVVTACPVGIYNAERQILSELQPVTRFARHTIIYREGSDTQDLFIVCSGSIKLVAHVRHRNRIAAIVGPGECFGIESLISGSKRQFTAITREASMLTHIDNTTINQEPELLAGRSITKYLALALTDAQRKIVLYSGDTARNRIAGVLAIFHSKQMALKNVEIAALLGISAETVSREIRQLHPGTAGMIN